MKKIFTIIAISIISISLMSVGNINWDAEPELDLLYKVDSRFFATITKSDLETAQTINDILPENATFSVVSYEDTEISIITDDGNITEAGHGNKINEAQISLLKKTDYTSNIYVRADYKIKNALYDKLDDRLLTYFITIVPKKEATYKPGYESLVNYLKNNSKESTRVIKQDKLQPGKVRFTVTKEGNIKNVNLESTSGYNSVDEVLLELISNMPGKWSPAVNAEGENVEQELVFFFGSEGC